MTLITMQTGLLVKVAAVALAGAAAYILGTLIVKERESMAAQENLADSGEKKNAPRLVQITRPFFTNYVVPLVRNKAIWDARRAIYRRKLISSGLREQLTPDEFIAFKFFLILFFPLVGVVLKVLGFIDLNGFLFVGLGVGGFFYPDIWVSQRIKFRQKQILRSMPFIVDLLALSTEAGLDFIGAIGKVVEKAAPSPLVDEFSQLLREIKVGASRADALRELGLRIDMSEMNSFIAILISADQMGASIGKILRQQSEQIRVNRMLLAEKAGAAAAQKVLLPLVLFILPAVLLMVFGPFLLQLIYPNGV